MMTISLSTILVLLITHYLFDFVLQSRYIADNKSKKMGILLEHVLIYTLGLFIISVSGLVNAGFWWILVNGVAHFATDAITSRITSRYFSQRRYYAGFSVIGFDQFIHIATLISTLVLVG